MARKLLDSRGEFDRSDGCPVLTPRLPGGVQFVLGEIVVAVGSRQRGARFGVASRLAMAASLPSQPSSVTVIREADGRYYVSFVVERDPQPLPAASRETGIDLGLSQFIATSDGEIIPNPRFLRARNGTLPGHSERCAARRGQRTGRRPGIA